MKLIHLAIRHLSVYIFLLVSIWSVLLYFALMFEINDSIDDGLDNYKLLIINEAQIDSSVLSQKQFDEGNYRIKEVRFDQALRIVDSYRDTLMYMPFEDELEPVRILYTAFEQSDKYYSLEIISSMVEEDDLIRDMVWFVIALYFLIVISILLINNLVLRRLWRPFYRIIQNFKKFKLGESSRPQPMAIKAQEFRELKNVTDELINRSINTFEQQKDFIGNASHELQTPISSAISKLELMLDKDSMPDDTGHELEVVLNTLYRMRQLNKSLLFLSKIEDNQFTENSEVLVNLVVKNILEELTDLSEANSNQITVENNSEIRINANLHLITILISNLIKNAIIYSTPGSTIEIILGNGIFSIQNSGLGASPDPSQIFNRFYKAGERSDSSGLGLAIASAICKQYHFQINYTKTHLHQFTVNFFSSEK